MASTRRLAAILAADVAGYSRLMGADEEGTHERIKGHFQQLINPKINEHQGRVVKNTGDGALVEFASVVDAVRCAAQIQRGMIDRDADMADECRIKLRIGVNLGDVIVERGDIFGDGVNVAARLEALAEPDGICVSGTVYDQIRDRLPYPFNDMGEQSVKNIARPVRVYGLSPEAVAELPASIAPPATSISQPAAAPRLSIVVLPFTNLSDDREQQYFADAITEDLTTDLSRIADMLVISRNTAFSYRNKAVDTKQIGRELGVRYALAGSVQRSENRVRVTAQLIDAETDTHLWAERFAADAGDLFVLQDEITGRIAVALDFEMVATEAARVTADPEALDYIFQGRAALNRPPTPDNYAETIGLFERALALDPRSVEAQSGLAQALVGRALDEMTDSAAADIARAEAPIARALATSPNSPIAHYAKGLLLRARHRYEEAILEYETVLATNRNWVYALADIGRCKIYIGRMDEAIPLMDQAIRLSPRDPYIGNFHFRVGEAHLLQSRIDEAVLCLERARSSNPALAYVHAYLAAAHALKGESDRAAAELAEARNLAGNDRYSSIARLRPGGYWGVPKVRALFEATLFAGLRKAGMSEK
jgi:adenylate cyclase